MATLLSIKAESPFARFPDQETRRCVKRDLFQETLDALLKGEWNHFQSEKEGPGASFSQSYVARRFASVLGEIYLNVPRDKSGTFHPQIVSGVKTFTEPQVSAILSLPFQNEKSRSYLLHCLYPEIKSTALFAALQQSLKKHFATFMGRGLPAEVAIVSFGRLPIPVSLETGSVSRFGSTTPIASGRHRVFARRTEIPSSLRSAPPLAQPVIGYALATYDNNISELLGVWTEDSSGKLAWEDICAKLQQRGLAKIRSAFVDASPGLIGAIRGKFPDASATLMNCTGHTDASGTKRNGTSPVVLPFTQDNKITNVGRAEAVSLIAESLLSKPTAERPIEAPLKKISATPLVEKSDVSSIRTAVPQRSSHRRSLVLPLAVMLAVATTVYVVGSTREEISLPSVVEEVIEVVENAPVSLFAHISPQLFSVDSLADRDLELILTAGDLGNKILIRALQEAANRDVVFLGKAVSTLTDHSDFRVRIEVAKVMDSPRYRDVALSTTTLIKLLTDEDYLVRGYAVRALGKRQNDRIRTILQAHLLIEENDTVQKLVHEAVGGAPPLVGTD